MRWGGHSARSGARRYGFAAAVVALLVMLLPAYAGAGALDGTRASSGAALGDDCRALEERLRGPCRGAEVLVAAASATCRYAGVVDDRRCTTPLGPEVSNAAVAAYRGSWVNRALRLQYDLAGDVGLRNAPFVGTHNSFNSIAEMGPTLSATDANQQLSLVDQLEIDVRSLELDVHYFPSVEGGGFAPVVCHATEQHGGCSVEKRLSVVLGEIAGWLEDHRDQVLLLYLEDHLDTREGYDEGATVLKRKLGGAIYRPSASAPACEPLPLELTRDEVLAAGKQVVVMSECGVGSAWPSLAFDGSAREEARPVGYTDFPDCGQDFGRDTHERTLIRYFEDSTGLTAGAATVGLASHDGGIDPATAGQMARCGVDLLGLDQLLPDDGRLEALVWSWARGEPGAAGGDCAVQRADARWEARSCSERHRVACTAPDGTWSVSGRAVPAVAAQRRCGPAAGVHSVPRTGYEGQLLRVAMESAGADEVWLAYRRPGGTWGALDSRG